MLITVNRFHSTDEATLSAVSVDEKLICFGLEDEQRDEKVSGETRIPAGHYKIGLRKEGGFHGRYYQDKRFKEYHRGMLQVLDVPGFEYILIHVGNTEKHTDGCLLVGLVPHAQNYRLINSAVAYETLYNMVIDAAEAGELEIVYADNDKVGA